MKMLQLSLFTIALTVVGSGFAATPACTAQQNALTACQNEKIGNRTKTAAQKISTCTAQQTALDKCKKPVPAAIPPKTQPSTPAPAVATPDACTTDKAALQAQLYAEKTAGADKQKMLDAANTACTTDKAALQEQLDAAKMFKADYDTCYKFCVGSGRSCSPALIYETSCPGQQQKKVCRCYRGSTKNGNLGTDGAANRNPAFEFDVDATVLK